MSTRTLWYASPPPTSHTASGVLGRRADARPRFRACTRPTLLAVWCAVRLQGRFKFLFDACDAQGIPRPKVHITEWGWDATSVPGPSTAVSDVSLVMTKAYAAYPQVQGGAIWCDWVLVAVLGARARRTSVALAERANV